MAEIKLIDNRHQFLLYGVINVLLLITLIIILILFFNDIFIFSRTVFVLFVGIHLFLLFFIKIHYLSAFYNDRKQTIEFHYNKKFGIYWKKKSRKVLLPLMQFDGYKLEKDAVGLYAISFFKLENKDRYELGPFYIGILSNTKKELIKSTFGESL
jgi:hypothetical protein